MKNAMKEAMSNSIPSTRSPDAEDQMLESMKENREGVDAVPVKGDQQIRAMSNQFELVEDKTLDPMKAAMTEQRVVVKKK